VGLFAGAIPLRLIPRNATVKYINCAPTLCKVIQSTLLLNMTLLFLQIFSSPAAVASLFLFSLLSYIIYQRFLHPLASSPGPLLASLTNLWKSYYVYNHILHEKLVELHEQHGSVVRIGPNDLHFWSAEAIAPIYKAGKAMGKTEFYDAFTTFNPNLFGTRNEAVNLRITLYADVSSATASRKLPLRKWNLLLTVRCQFSSIISKNMQRPARFST